ncbi:lipase [Serratia marcescens]|nr:lipase [Serratia marcescens]
MREIQPPRSASNPLILVHGRNADSGVWVALKSYLLTQGYTDDLLFGWNYDSSQSVNEVLAGQFKTYVADVLSQTGADKVDIVAHSLGSLLTRWFIKFEGGKDSVRQWISIAGPNHGTQLGWLCALWDQGCRDMTPGSYVITNLNQDTETPNPTQYTTIWSAGDEQISPPTSTPLSGADNIQVSQMKHNELLASEEVFEHILNTLTTEE